MRKVFVLLFAILCISLLAQELNELSIVGKAVKTNDIVSSSIKDVNNRKASCIIFLTDLDVDMDFKPNIELVKLISNTGRHEVYVQPGERVIEVLASGFKPLNLVLSSYGISKLESGDVYQIEITGEKKTILASGKGDLILETEPSGAEISIEEFPDFKANTPYEFNNYLARPYKIHLTTHRYEPVDIVITIEKDKKHSETIELQQKWGDLKVVSDPSDADVYINNTNYGKTPINLKGIENGLDSGIYSLRISKKKYVEKIMNINIENGKRLFIDNIDLLAKTSSISVEVNPQDALIELRGDDGEYYILKPSHEYNDILYGSYHLKVSRDGFKSFREKIDLVQDGKTLKQISLVEGLDVPKGFVFVEGGTFLMGDTSEENKKKYHPKIKEKNVKSFYISKYEVTQQEWQEVMLDNRFESSNLPAIDINWYEAVEFCNKKSIIDGLTPCYTIDKINKDPENTSVYDPDDPWTTVNDKYKWTVTCNFEVDGYRLPTEIEWEFAARGGLKSKEFNFSGSNNIGDIGWYDSNSKKFGSYNYPHTVGKKKHNELGLYDMSGNAREWCWDWHSPGSLYHKKKPKRVTRGGDYRSSPDELFVWNRERQNRFPSVSFCAGIRLVRSKN